MVWAQYLTGVVSPVAESWNTVASKPADVRRPRSAHRFIRRCAIAQPDATLSDAYRIPHRPGSQGCFRLLFPLLPVQIVHRDIEFFKGWTVRIVVPFMIAELSVPWARNSPAL